jgi:hypothetical protein
MKKILCAVVMVLLLLGASLPANAYMDGRKGSFRLGLYGPGLFVGNKNIDAMISFGIDGEYFFLENLSANFRVEEATDFGAGDPPHSVFTFIARARYVFDVGSSGKWSIYVQGGGGGALIGSSHGAGDLSIPGGGFWYQWNNNWSFGADANMHILIRDETAIAFDVTPVVRYQF